MEVHLVDGTYELFRHFFAVPSHKTSEGLEVAATRGVIGTLIRLLEDGATHIGVATDQTIESFRNELFDGYNLMRKYNIIAILLNSYSRAIRCRIFLKKNSNIMIKSIPITRVTRVDVTQYAT